MSRHGAKEASPPVNRETGAGGLDAAVVNDGARHATTALVGVLFGAVAPAVVFFARTRHAAGWLWPTPPGCDRAGVSAPVGLVILVSIFGFQLAKHPRWKRFTPVGLCVLISALLFRWQKVRGPTGDGLTHWIRLADDPFIMGSE